MISLFFIVKIFTLLAAVVLASAILGRDPGLRINRLMATVPALLALWSLGEISWNLQPDPVAAEQILRLTSGAWMMLGPACLHIYSELVGTQRPWASRLVPISYGLSAIVFLIHLFTGWGLVGVVPAPWGYVGRLSLNFMFLYAALSAPLLYMLFGWRRVRPREEATGEQMVWSTLFMYVATALGIATVTDIIFPVVGLQFPPLGTTSVVLVVFGIVDQLKRHSYSLLAPGSFAGQILGALRDGVVLLRATGEVRVANTAFEQLVGATRSEIRNVPFSRFAPSLAVDPSRMTDDVECNLIKSNGEVIPVLISPTPLQNPSGSVRGAALVIRDLQEVFALRGSLAASDRLATVGGLSASIAEEIREPIHEMRSHLEGMRQQLDCLGEAVRRCESTEKLADLVGDREELIDECIEGVERVEAIMRDVRGFASEGSGRLETVDINGLVEDALRIALARADTEISVERNFDDLVPVLCVPGEIVQVLVNLLINAIQATAGRGHVQLATWQHDNEVWICIEDDGCGIGHDVIPRVFDPFFTTKPVGHGTGLGLAISHHIIRNHGGDVRVESEVGRGARFTVALPVDPSVSRNREMFLHA
jgi:PAS domain S-box-containing protein